jgi:integrase
MTPPALKRSARTRETRRTLKPRQSSAAVRAARPDRAWSVSYREPRPDGSLAYARRFFATRAEADAFCAEKRATLASLGNLGAGLSDKVKREALMGLEMLKPYGKTLADAVAYYVRELEMRGASKTVAQAIASLSADSASRGLSTRHLNAMRTILARFALEHGNEVVATVRGEKVQAWLDGLRTPAGKPLGAVSFNTYRRYLSRLFSYCVRRKWARENPVQDFDARAVRQRAPRLLGAGDLQQILAACDDELRPALVLQAFCGLRVAEAARAEWDDLLPSGNLRVGAEKAKTGKRRLCPVPVQALAYLVSARKPSGLIFAANPRAERVDALMKALAATRRAVPQVKWGKNALRASALSYRLAQTQDAPRTALEMGNSPQVLLRDYRELATPEQALAWFNVDPSNPLPRVLRMKPAARRRTGTA